MTNDTESLATDLLWGAKAIADELGISPRKVFWLAESGHIPVRKVGKILTSSRRALREHLTPAPAVTTEKREVA